MDSAESLTALLAVEPGDTNARVAASHLIDAYLHDPHLERD